jgi:hypothetical protein
MLSAGIRVPLTQLSFAHFERFLHPGGFYQGIPLSCIGKIRAFAL